MPEGHTVHRLAAALAELYGGQRLRASSPQGRFAAGAARLDGMVLLDSQAHGKHLFLAFGPQPSARAAFGPGPDDCPGGADDADGGPRGPARPGSRGAGGAVVTWLRVHLGLYGSWTFDGDSEFTAPHAIGAPRRRVGERGEHALRGGGGSALSGLSGQERGQEEVPGRAPGQWAPPEPRGAVRLRLHGEHGVADLTGPAACELLDAQGVAAVRRRLGPDPLRPDGDANLFVSAASGRRRPVGDLLMDQSVIAGAGNIYRAETLFRVGVSPFTAGSQVGEDRLRRIWEDLTPLMRYGVATGFITTVEGCDVPCPVPEDDPEAGRWYVYHRTGRPCLRCSTPVREQEMLGRRLFWCPTCQAD